MDRKNKRKQVVKVPYNNITLTVVVVGVDGVSGHWVLGINISVPSD